MANESPFTIFDLLMGFALGFAQSIPPIARNGEQILNYKWPNAMLNLTDYVNAYNLGIVEKPEYDNYVRKLGYDERHQEIVDILSTVYLTPMDYVIALRRGFITEDDFAELMTALKMTGTTSTTLRQLAEFQPGPQDLVEFAVREVYSPEIAEIYGQFEDIPEQYLAECVKTGLPRQQAINYWAAHWKLPSAEMGYEMYHRRIITEDELKTLLKTVDYMPYWRDKLVQMSYNPLTRVDVRRMYGLGVLNAEDVYNSYLDLGYSPDNARRMTEFTIKYETSTEEGLSRASVCGAFIDELIDEASLREYLAALDYTQEKIEWYVRDAKYSKTANQIKQDTDEIIAQYKLGALSQDEARQMLINLDVPSAYVKSVMTKLLSAVSSKLKLPSKDELLVWFEENLIDEQTFSQRMLTLGYRSTDIHIYLTRFINAGHRASVKYLNDKKYFEWLLADIMSVAEFTTVMLKAGYLQADIDRYILEYKGVQSGATTTT